MNSIQQTCPTCLRLLELPADSAGRKARCPACQTEFVIGSSAADANPFAKPIGAEIVDERPTRSSGGTNPYQPAAAVSTAGQTVSVGSFRISQRSVEEIFGATWAMFKARWQSLVGAFALVFGISIAMMIASAVIGAIAQQTLDRTTSSIVSGMLNVVTTPISVWLYLGLVCNALAVARDEPSPLGRLMPPMLSFYRFLGGGVLLTLALGGVLAVVGGIVAVLLAIGAGDQLAFGLILLVVLVSVPVMMAAYWMLWSWPMAVADGRATWLDSFRVAYQISMQNKMTSFLLIILTALLGIAGLMACYVGQIFTTPLATLMLATAYLMMTTQPIADPRLGVRNWE